MTVQSPEIPRHGPPANFSRFDEACMRRAMVLARRGLGRVEPNPMVGCVVARGARVLAEGFHPRYGGPHAEVVALTKAGRRARGSTVYVTLEPCGHYGKTPPCTEVLIAAGVRRVVIPLSDPNPAVSGKGMMRLRAAGIRVDEGLSREQATDLMLPYLTLLRTGRPYVILKWAQSLDGKLATASGDSQWISGEASRREVHRLRARVDAIVVGVNTVLADDPELTARGARRRRIAARVVLDSRLRTPPTARLFSTGDSAPVQIVTTFSTVRRRADRARKLARAGAEVVAVRSDRGRVHLDPLLEELGQRQYTNILIEGGPTLLKAFLDARLADEAWVFVCPLFLGRSSPYSAGPTRAASRVAEIPPLRLSSVRRLGDDFLYRFKLRK